MKFEKLTEENKPQGQFLGFNKKWIHEDWNPEGIRLCHWCDVSGWVSSFWCNYHEEYETRLSSEDSKQHELSKGEDQVPTHFCIIKTDSL